MERDQHPGAEQGAPDRRGGDVPDPGRALPEEASTPPPAPEAGDAPDLIMSKLPRTRPQRLSARRNRESAGATATSRKAGAAADARKRAAGRRAATPERAAARTGQSARSAPGRPKSRAGTAARAAKQGAGTARPATTARTRSTRRPGPVAGVPPQRPAQAAARSRRGDAPSLPRLAVDGAVEAAKLPMKVGGRLTLRALDAVARGLRGR